MTSTRRLAALVPLGLISLGSALAACGGSAEHSADAPGATGAVPAATETAAEPVPPPIAKEAPPASIEAVPVASDAAIAVPSALQFRAPLVGGGELDVASLAGKPTVFWFWAPT